MQCLFRKRAKFFRKRAIYFRSMVRHTHVWLRQRFEMSSANLIMR